jgi:hypothetical protein
VCQGPFDGYHGTRIAQVTLTVDLGLFSKPNGPIAAAVASPMATTAYPEGEAGSLEFGFTVVLVAFGLWWFYLAATVDSRIRRRLDIQRRPKRSIPATIRYRRHR